MPCLRGLLASFEACFDVMIQRLKIKKVDGEQ
jgi:hypothetical protein